TDLRPTQHMYEVQVPNKTAHVFQHPGTQAFDLYLPRAGLWLTTVTRVYDRTTRVWSTTHPLVERSLASLEQLTRAERDIGGRLRPWWRGAAREAARARGLRAGQPIVPTHGEMLALLPLDPLGMFEPSPAPPWLADLDVRTLPPGMVPEF